MKYSRPKLRLFSHPDSNARCVDGSGANFGTVCEGGDAYDGSFGRGDCGAGDWDTYCSDGFVTKLTSDGTALVYSTFFGGSTANYFKDIALDAAGNAYAAGRYYIAVKFTPAGGPGL